MAYGTPVLGLVAASLRRFARYGAKALAGGCRRLWSGWLWLRAKARHAVRHERKAVAAGVGTTGLLSLLAMLVLLPKPFALAHAIAALGTLQVMAALHLLLSHVPAQAARPSTDGPDSEQRERVEDMLWRLKERETHYRDLLDAQGSVIISRDVRGAVTFANRAFCRLFGLEREALIGKPLEIAVLDGDRAHAATGTRRDARRYTQQVETVMGPRWIEWEQHSVSLGSGPSETECVGRDVTAERLRAAELAAGRDEALAANSAKSTFLAAMSHEIRTPMSGILGMSGLLLGTEATPEQQTYARAIDRSARTLLKLIDEILDFSKIEAGRLTLNVAPFGLEDCVESVIELLAPRAHEKGLEIAWLMEPDVPLTVAGDEARVRQILLNLVGNAIKFTDAGGVCVRVARHGAAAGGSLRDRRLGITISVEDTGIGLSKSDLARLFTDFVQAERGGSRRKGGTGLGLAISRRLAQAMGGDICVESTPGRGSTFCVDLVLLEQPGAELAGAAVASDAARTRRVLIASDRGIERRLAGRALVASGMQVRDAGLDTSVEALNQAGADGTACNVIVVDAEAGVPQARYLLEQAKATAAGTSRVDGIVVIDAASRSELPAFRAAGYTGWAVRPVRPRAFTRLVARGECGDASEPMRTLVVASEALPVRSNGRTTRVLLAEDDDVNALLGSCVLQKAGCLPTLVRTGREAVEAVRLGLAAGEPDFDIILMDIIMPDLGGIDASRAIQNLYAALSGTGRSAPPIVALTANAFAEDRERYLAAGLDDYLAKPFDRADLQALLERWAGRLAPASAA